MKNILRFCFIMLMGLCFGCRSKVDSLTSIPDDAEIIFSAMWEQNDNDTVSSARWKDAKAVSSNTTNELYVMDSNGENITRITYNGKYYNHFAVSPNRRMIAAIRFSYGDTNGNGTIDWADQKVLWIMDLENREEWPLFPWLNAGWGGVDWSPDGNYVYLSIIKDAKSDIYKVRIDGREMINITENLQQNLGDPETGKWVSDVSVSFDGEWLAMLYGGNPADASDNKPNIIVICRIDGTEARKVTDGGEFIEGNFDTWGRGDFDPEFSPDGQYIVFQRATNTGLNFGWMTSHDIFTIKIDGTELKKLSPDGNTGGHGVADWSWDNRIIFSEWNEADNYIGPVMVNPDGTNYHRLTDVPSGATFVRWIPPLSDAARRQVGN